MPPDDTTPRQQASGTLAKLHDVEQRIETSVEAALVSAEQSLARRLGARCVGALRLGLRALFAAAVVAYFAFGAAILVLRYGMLPQIEDQRGRIEAIASRALDMDVRIGRIEADWYGLNPRLKLTDVQLHRRGAAAGAETALSLPQLEATLSWSSAWRLSPRFASLSVLAPELQVQRRADGTWQIAGFVLDPRVAPEPDADTRALDWLLGQRRIAITDARVTYVDETNLVDGRPRRVLLDDVQIRADAGWRSNRFALRATPPGDIAAPVDVRVDVVHPLFESASTMASWSGRVFAQTDFVDLARVKPLLPPIPGSVRLDAAQGALRVWVDFDRKTARRITSDLALADVLVQLGPELAPLALDSARGRFAFREFGNELDGGVEYSVDGFSVSGRAVDPAAADRASGPRVVLPPTRLRLQLSRATESRPARGELDAALISLDQVSALAAHVPLGRDVRALIARQAARGELNQLAARWEGEFVFDETSGALRKLPASYSVKTRFSNLASAAIAADPPLDEHGRHRAGVPGFQNLSGQIDVNQSGGSAQIESRSLTLDLPGIIEERRTFAAVTGSVSWSRPRADTTPAPFELRVDRLAAVNDDISLTVNGSYRSGGKGGFADVTARIDRLAAKEAVHYLPLGIGAPTLTWLRDALQAGTASDGMIRLRGDLADFPFADGKSGEFRASTRLRNATLDYAANLRRDPGAGSWPALRELDADLVFERKRMEITGRRAMAEGVALSNLTARIADLGASDVRLRIAGRLRGPLADMLRTVAQSPVGPRLGGALAGATATGEASGDLTLDVPLSDLTTRTIVGGSFALTGNDIVLRFLPPFTRAAGRIDFTDRSVQLSNINAGFIGGQLQLNAETAADGSIVFRATGGATPAGARRLLDSALLQRVLDRSAGAARYSATVTLRNGVPAIRVDSDLVGWSVDLPPPLAKSAGEALPLRVAVARSETNTNQDRIDIAAGSVLAVQFERDLTRADDVRVLHGAIRVSDESPTEPPVMPATGVLAEVTLARLDFDRWQQVLQPAATAAPAARSRGGDGSGLPDLIAARVRELRVAGKPIANVVLGATRIVDGANAGGWQINAESDQASGSLLVRLADGGQDARVTARLARLTIPDAQRGEITELLDAPPTDMPGFDVIAENFELGKRKLGRLELIAQNTAGDSAGNTPDWQLQKLEIINPDGKLAATGQWARDPRATGAQAPRRMSLKLALDFSNGGALLARLGIPDALRGTSGRLEGEIAWRGSPFVIDFPSLSGAVKLNAEKGQFLKADAGAGRLLGVLSLQSLPRRLTLDFRDIFSDGFAFDALRASADITDGVLSTRDLRMRGVSATVLMEGSVDLPKETQSLHVLVLPEINAGSASLLYAALANPAIGIGTFLAQWVLRDPLSKVFSFEYDITGAWSDPQVKRRAKTAVEDSAKKPPQ